MTVEVGSLALHMGAQRQCNDSLRDKVERLLAVIRHQGTRTHGPADPTCADCCLFIKLRDSTESWPWRDYYTDEPRAGDE